ncbi:MAG: hypothetical protein LJE84_03190 [Gammaproteobacteria bacterium]|nr:hypothetical protein [Gammaproteobacteria bacterium]
MSPDHLILNDSESAAQALLDLVHRGAREIRLYARSFDPRLFNRPTLEKAIAQLVIRDVRAQVQILTGDPQNLLRDAARLVALARQYPSRVQVRGFNDREFAAPPGFYALVDKLGYLGRKNDFEAEIECGQLEPVDAERLAREFDKRWQESLTLDGIFVAGL